MTALMTAKRHACSPSLSREALAPRGLEKDAQDESSDGSGLAILLEEPAIALWASEAAARYGVSALHALGMLAEALLLDTQC